ncbi:unnamed protein product, partial [Discosporangium mesarthrocarpum]
NFSGAYGEYGEIIFGNSAVFKRNTSEIREKLFFRKHI